MTDRNPTLIVHDNGCGIDPQIRTEIFTTGFSTKPSHGTGLGLGIVDKICREYGATVSVESVVGEGSKFTIFFQSRPIEKFVEVVQS